jgi:gamma-butyrobetaine dioxygenase
VSAAPAASVDDVFALYDAWGADNYDEDVSQLAHALQTAALAASADAADALVAAALLHDAGHLLHLRDGGHAHVRHEDIGAAWLGRLLGVAVAAPVALHVQAKRDLCAIEPTYPARLSAGSVRSLERQGGPMAGVEIATFEAEPGAAAAADLRRWDDAAKLHDQSVPPLEHYRPLLNRLGGRPG